MNNQTQLANQNLEDINDILDGFIQQMSELSVSTLSPLGIRRLDELSPEHIDAALKMVNHFNTFRHVLLTAQMQSGKTLTYMLAAAELVRRGKVNKILFMSGNQEIELREQLKKNWKKFIAIYRRYLMNVCGFSIYQADMLIEHLDNHVEIRCGHQLTKPCGPITDTVIVWDESHFAQSLCNRPAQFLDTHGIPANGDVAKLTAKNAFILSVSATPFSECSDMKHLAQPKGCVYLTPGENYFGVKHMKDRGLLVKFTNPVEAFQAEVERIDSTARSPKNFLVRVTKPAPVPRNRNRLARRRPDNVLDETQIRRYAQGKGWDVKTYDSSSASDIKSINELENAPERHTIVILKEMCRMGKNVPKQHIAAVMETSVHANTDTILQSLLGRMCGYDNRGNIRVSLCAEFLNSDELNCYIQWCAGHQIMPQNAKNLVKPANQELKRIERAVLTNKPANAIIQILIPRESRVGEDGAQDIDDMGRNNTAYIVDSIRAVFNEARPIVDYNSPDQSAEIREKLADLTTPVLVKKIRRALDGTILPATYADIPRKIHENVTTRIPGRLGSGCGISIRGIEVILWWAETDIPEYGLRKGDVYLDARTVAANAEYHDTLLTNSRIPKTTGKEVFSGKPAVYDEAGEDEAFEHANGVYAVGLPEDTQYDPESMMRSLVDMVRISNQRTEHVLPPRKVNSPPGGILVTQAVYDAMQPRGAIYQRVFVEEGARLKTMKVRGRAPAGARGMIRLSEISW